MAQGTRELEEGGLVRRKELYGRVSVCSMTREGRNGRVRDGRGE